MIYFVFIFKGLILMGILNFLNLIERKLKYVKVI